MRGEELKPDGFVAEEGGSAQGAGLRPNSKWHFSEAQKLFFNEFGKYLYQAQLKHGRAPKAEGPALPESQNGSGFREPTNPNSQESP